MSRIMTCDFCYQEINGSAESISQGSFDWCDEDCLNRWRSDNKVAQGGVRTDAVDEKSSPADSLHGPLNESAPLRILPAEDVDSQTKKAALDFMKSGFFGKNS